ncbi:MAG: hypothetical protein SF053_00580 [Bacteroidia bacterium]|nr:hypothetical protein [Bacteroidia bacterium]
MRKIPRFFTGVCICILFGNGLFCSPESKCKRLEKAYEHWHNSYGKYDHSGDIILMYKEYCYIDSVLGIEPSRNCDVYNSLSEARANVSTEIRKQSTASSVFLDSLLSIFRECPKSLRDTLIDQADARLQQIQKKMDSIKTLKPSASNILSNAASHVSSARQQIKDGAFTTGITPILAEASKAISLAENCQEPRPLPSDGSSPRRPSEFDRYVRLGDVLFAAIKSKGAIGEFDCQDLEKARDYYEKANDLKPYDASARDKITEIEQFIRDNALGC